MQHFAILNIPPSMESLDKSTLVIISQLIRNCNTSIDFYSPKTRFFYENFCGIWCGNPVEKLLGMAYSHCPARTAYYRMSASADLLFVLRGRRTRGPGAGPLVNHPRQGFPPWTSLTRCIASNCENCPFVHRYNTCRLLVFILLTAGCRGNVRSTKYRHPFARG